MDMRFGTWNVMSLYRVGSQKTIASELVGYNLYLVAERDVSWDDGGSKQAAIIHFSMYKRKEKDHSKELYVDSWIILEWILGK
jgi:hypothetical protein